MISGVCRGQPQRREFAHPLMEKRAVKKRAVVVVSTDKGLCGALNAI